MKNIVIIDELISELIKFKKYPNNTDISDIGNIVGIVIGKHLSDEAGFDKESFLHGLNHGFSLSDGTH